MSSNVLDHSLDYMYEYRNRWRWWTCRYHFVRKENVKFHTTQFLSMNSSVLFPPNNETLSDNVIGVKTRANKQDMYSMIANDGNLVQQRNLHHDINRSSHTKGSNTIVKSSHPQARTATSTCKKITLNELLRSQANKSSILELVLLGKRMERQRWRENQSRYRKKHIEYVANLEEAKRQLQCEIKRLERRKSDLRSGTSRELVLRRTSIWSVAVAYIETFRHGLVSETARNTDKLLLSFQLNFMQTKVSPTVGFSGGCGTDALLRNWGCFSLALENFEMELERLEKESFNSVVATTRTSFTLTERTSRHIFPHLLGADTEVGDAMLLQQLVGKDIVVFGRTRFEWDNSEGYLTSIMAQSDFLTPVLGLVSSLENVSRVFDKSRISPEFI